MLKSTAKQERPFSVTVKERGAASIFLNLREDCLPLEQNVFVNKRKQKRPLSFTACQLNRPSLMATSTLFNHHTAPLESLGVLQATDFLQLTIK